VGDTPAWYRAILFGIAAFIWLARRSVLVLLFGAYALLDSIPAAIGHPAVW
jgi:hypothetical protein